MKLWLLLTLALTIQEGVTTLALLYHAFQLRYSLWIISAIWLVVTVAQIWLGIFVGKYVRKKATGSKFDRWAKKQTHWLDEKISRNGEKLALFLVSNTVSPALSAFVAAWFDISVWNVFLFTFLGDLLWYLSILATAFGAFKFLGTVKYGLVIFIVVIIVLIALIGFAKRKKGH